MCSDGSVRSAFFQQDELIRHYLLVVAPERRGREVSWPSVQPTLSDDEIVLREWEQTDADDVYTACQDPDIQRYTNVPVPYLREHANFFVGEFQRNNWTGRSGVGFASPTAAATT